MTESHCDEKTISSFHSCMRTSANQMHRALMSSSVAPDGASARLDQWVKGILSRFDLVNSLAIVHFESDLATIWPHWAHSRIVWERAEDGVVARGVQPSCAWRWGCGCTATTALRWPAAECSSWWAGQRHCRWAGGGGGEPWKGCLRSPWQSRGLAGWCCCRQRCEDQ